MLSCCPTDMIFKRHSLTRLFDSTKKNVSYAISVSFVYTDKRAISAVDPVFYKIVLLFGDANRLVFNFTFTGVHRSLPCFKLILLYENSARVTTKGSNSFIGGIWFQNKFLNFLMESGWHVYSLEFFWHLFSSLL